VRIRNSEPEILQSGETLESLGLSRWQKAKLRILGDVFLGMEKHEGWKGFLPVSLSRCYKHGLFKSHPRGRGSLDFCPKCIAETALFLKQLENN
jgi:hypothetical protein